MVRVIYNRSLRVAVAVSAIMWTDDGTKLRISLILSSTRWKVSTQKCWKTVVLGRYIILLRCTYHFLTQWTSSITKALSLLAYTSPCIILLHVLLLIIISGVKKTNWYILRETTSMVAQSVTSSEIQVLERPLKNRWQPAINNRLLY